MIVFENDAFLNREKSVRFGFFGRQGGVSEGLYSSLNCGPGSDDDPKMVCENRARVAGHLGAKSENLISLWQVHSADCLTITESLPARPKADAMVTDRAGLALGVLTADCGPVLFYGEKPDGSPVVGAAHAGWKGALGGVLNATLQSMQDLGAQRESIRACIGPCIAQASYEVGEGFEAPFLKQSPENERFFKSSVKDGHLMFDLPGYIASALFMAGVRQVSITDIDTYQEEERCFSYRRTTHNKESDYGRQISAIMIES